MYKKDAIRLGWNGIGPEQRERLRKEAISGEDLERIRRSIHPGDRVTWVIAGNMGQEKDNHCRKVRVTVTGCYKYVVTAQARTGRVFSKTYIELELERRRRSGGRIGKSGCEVV